VTQLLQRTALQQLEFDSPVTKKKAPTKAEAFFLVTLWGMFWNTLYSSLVIMSERLEKLAN